ncbi:MAG: DNA primase [Clostridiaceae bacterium]|nr:DNA primase [Eubacteriales bacterium]
MALFPDAWMGELLSKSDIVSLVSEYVSLKPKGRRMWGCCPFHNEKTPSFSVDTDKQLYYCFGCHAGGSAIQFVMEVEKLPYAEAIKFLAQRANLELPEVINDEKLRKERAHKERLYAACVEAARYYHRELMGPGGEQARRYLFKRGIDGAMVKRFGLGYAPAGWENLVKYLSEKGFTEEELISAGLAVRGKNKSSCYDAFRDRLIFPIIAANGRVIAFGARTMKNENPKYINTGDTPIYNKRQNLYALNLQKGKQAADLIMVEGYMDVISLHKGGVENAVASLGTALTVQQARLLKRYVQKVYVCYDGDAAGQNATLRGMDILAAEGLDVKIMSVPEELDPDDYIRRFGRDAFLRLQDSALSLSAFKLEHMAKGFDFSLEDGREGYAKKACAFVATLEPVEQERYVPLIARKTGLNVNSIKAQCSMAGARPQNSIGKNRNTRIKKTEENQGKRRKLERMLLACMMSSKETAFFTAEKMAAENLKFSAPGEQRFADELLVAYMESDKPELELLIARCEPEGAEAVMAALEDEESLIEPERVALDCIARLSEDALKERINELNASYMCGAAGTEALEEAKRLQLKLKRPRA